MGQVELLKSLAALKQIDDRYYTTKEIIKFMKANKINPNGIYSDLLQLAAFEIIKYRGVGIFNHHKEFKSKER